MHAKEEGPNNTAYKTAKENLTKLISDISDSEEKKRKQDFMQRQFQELDKIVEGQETDFTKNNETINNFYRESIDNLCDDMSVEIKQGITFVAVTALAVLIGVTIGALAGLWTGPGAVASAFLGGKIALMLCSTGFGMMVGVLAASGVKDSNEQFRNALIDIKKEIQPSSDLDT